MHLCSQLISVNGPPNGFSTQVEQQRLAEHDAL